MSRWNEHNPQKAVFKINGDEALHGDVIITLDNAPNGFELMPHVKDHCLAHGEVTGHAHKLVSGDFELRECPKTKTKHLRVITEAFLKHEEHSPIILPPGDYRIGIQREYSPWEKIIRKVAD